MLRRSEELRSYGVIDGSTLQVGNRMFGGGRRKDKKSEAEKKQVEDPRTTMQGQLEQKSEEHSDDDRSRVIQEEEEEVNQQLGETKGIGRSSRAWQKEVILKWNTRCEPIWRHSRSGRELDKGQVENIDRGIRRVVEARRRDTDRKGEQQESAFWRGGADRGVSNEEH